MQKILIEKAKQLICEGVVTRVLGWKKGEFCYGQWGYMVDLDLGCIRPALVSDGSVGLRPAFCLPQG